jgi:hypothetical protein
MIRRSTHGGESNGRSFPVVPYKPSIPVVGFFVYVQKRATLSGGGVWFFPAYKNKGNPTTDMSQLLWFK